MEYIKNQDYDYIMNKYHKQDGSFDSFSRFIRHDAIFDPATGMNPELIKEGFMKQDMELEDLPHTIRKAKAVEYILKNTRISCDKRDVFPVVNMIDRPLSELNWTWRCEVFEEILPEVGKRRDYYESAGIATMWPDYDHSVPVWDRIFALGFAGILKESEAAKERLAAKNDLTQEQETFFEGISIVYQAILTLIGRLSELAEKTEGSQRMAVALRNIQVKAPESFYEALLVDYIYFIVSEHIEGLQVRSLSNFDRLFYPFYISDRKRGVTEEEIRRDLAYFFLQFTAIGNYWGQPVFLGGCKEDETTEINELSYIFLDVYDKMGIYNPKIQLKIAESTPKAFTQKALDMIRRGRNSIVFVSDATIRAALMKVGVSHEQARLCNITGCYEYSPRGSLQTGMNYVNLLKPLEYALHEGCDGVNGNFSGNKSPAVEEYATFEEFFEEYKRQLKYVIDVIVETVNAYENYMLHVNPQSMLSATFPACLESGKDAFDGGALRNGTGMAFGYIANIADSLTNIKKYVFDEKRLTLRQLTEALDKNYVGYESLQKVFLADRDKFGNNKELPDNFAKEIVEFITENLCGRPNAEKRGGKWNCSFHVARMSYDQGKTTAASPDGRKFGEELAKNVSASMGMNREGATAAILSTTKIDATSFTGDACLDLGLHPSAVKGKDGLEAMYGLLQTFVKRGGHALHINVFDADTLRAAQREPEKYQDLQIRVCGWNVLFNDINKKEQDGFIKQAESLI